MSLALGSSYDLRLLWIRCVCPKLSWLGFFGEVVEWLMALGCKPSVLRDYEGSNPSLSTTVWNAMSGSNSVGRVIAFQAIGRGFESRLPLQRSIRTGVPIGEPARVETRRDEGHSPCCPEIGLRAHVAQSVERVLGKDEVTSSILVVGSSGLI